MIECQLVKRSLSNNLFITSDHKDLFEDHSVKLGICEEKYNKFLKIQQEYDDMQKELKVLHQIHTP